MKNEEIIELAKQAEFVNLDLCSSELERFAKLITEKEREACAKLCEDSVEYAGGTLADAIRARGQA